MTEGITGTCESCGAPIQVGETVCPYCQHIVGSPVASPAAGSIPAVAATSARTVTKRKKAWWKRWWVIAIEVFIVIGAIASLTNPQPSTNGAPASATPTASPIGTASQAPATAATEAPTAPPTAPPATAPPPAAPVTSGFDHNAAKAAGASAICGDGTWSYSAHRSGTCSSHGGVNWWTGNLGAAGPG